MDSTYNVYGVVNDNTVISGTNADYLNAIQKVDSDESSKTLFDGLYTASLNMFNETNDKQIEANQQQIDYLTGKTDNMLGVIMAQESALSSLNFTVQVTNKMVEVYKQIMQIQI